jgi:hypothetical protein
MSNWTFAWIIWIAEFIIIEGTALLNDRDNDTLSEHLRLWFRTDVKIGRTIWLLVSGVFFGWFIVHIAVAGSA